MARDGDLQGYSRVDALRYAYMATEHELLGRGDEAFGRLMYEPIAARAKQGHAPPVPRPHQALW